ncbi:ABC transporter permease [Lichenifustis flavocetrariae]|uniref:ABC transporter permease n=1 Tax=Lichenifustis flavocetrariae TaxID=2949735 RepID=A0AA41Z774_9HYPH|nr:ABC transporter permease [Lichenifustis flavocetrariae]MCW6510527.1 ABC transporter permease [Lichenifustis flavocetrariae]
MTALVQRYGGALTGIIIALTAFWLLAMVILPNLILLEFSFRPYIPVDQMGGPNDHYTLANYATFFTSPIHLQIFGLTVFYSSVVTLICLVLAYPLAYFLAKVSTPRNAGTWFLLLLIPLWVSEVLRSFAWSIILAYQGPLNAALHGLGLIDKGIRWRTGFNGVLIGLVYTYVLFMVFPIYNAIQSLDTNQIEAAQDLGAPLWRIHWRVVIPHAKPGIGSGCIMVFMLSAGSILVPSILGSTTSRWFTEIIQQWFFESVDWNTGSAYAFLLLVLCTVFVSLMMRMLNVRLVDIAR